MTITVIQLFWSSEGPLARVGITRASEPRKGSIASLVSQQFLYLLTGCDQLREGQVIEVSA